MTSIRKEGKINEDTTLIDVMMLGLPGGVAIYLVEGEKKCLIDGGNGPEARRLVKVLQKLNAFPPDIIIVTHFHFDHTQGIPYFRKKAAKLNKKIEVMASQTAIPLLEDQSFNDIYGIGPYKNIVEVTPLKEGDRIDLDGIKLKIFEVPGHSKDHIAILDEKNKNIFVGDAIGVKATDDFFSSPPFMPPFFDKEAYYNSINKLKKIDYKTLCLAHFGYIYDKEAKDILDESVSTFEKWWKLFEDNIEKLDDIDYMVDKVLDNCYPEYIDKKIAKIRLQNSVPWLINSFKTYKKI